LVYNQIVALETTIPAEQLMRMLLDIEKQLGRDRSQSESYESRVIDLDLLSYGTLVIHIPDLTLPHPRMHERRFVLIPMDEIASNLLHPKLNKTIRELLIECLDKSEVRKILS